MIRICISFAIQLDVGLLLVRSFFFFFFFFFDEVLFFVMSFDVNHCLMSLEDCALSWVSPYLLLVINDQKQGHIRETELAHKKDLTVFRFVGLQMRISSPLF